MSAPALSRWSSWSSTGQGHSQSKAVPRKGLVLTERPCLRLPATRGPDTSPPTTQRMVTFQSFYVYTLLKPGET